MGPTAAYVSPSTITTMTSTLAIPSHVLSLVEDAPLPLQLDQGVQLVSLEGSALYVPGGHAAHTESLTLVHGCSM